VARRRPLNRIEALPRAGGDPRREVNGT